MRVWWVRHGPTHQTSMTGWRDVPADLSDQARLSRLSAALPPDAPILSSDLARAKATADAIAGNRPRWPDADALREFNFGEWDGKPFDALPEQESRAFWENPGTLAPPGGESWNDVKGRVDAFVDSVLSSDPIADLIIVAHMGVIMTQIARAAGVSPYQAMGHRIDPLSITDMTHEKGHWHIGQINHCP